MVSSIPRVVMVCLMAVPSTAAPFPCLLSVPAFSERNDSRLAAVSGVPVPATLAPVERTACSVPACDPTGLLSGACCGAGTGAVDC